MTLDLNYIYDFVYIFILSNKYYYISCRWGVRSIFIYMYMYVGSTGYIYIYMYVYNYHKKNYFWKIKDKKIYQITYILIISNAKNYIFNIRVGMEKYVYIYK